MSEFADDVFSINPEEIITTQVDINGKLKDVSLYNMIKPALKIVI